MKIESGKFYLNRAGFKIGPMEYYRDRARLYPWTGKGGCHYADDGTCCNNSNCPDHLVSEWTEPNTGPVRTVTRKEIVPGVYGQVRVLSPHASFPNHAHVRIDDGLSSADELRAAATTLIEIADALTASTEGAANA